MNLVTFVGYSLNSANDALALPFLAGGLIFILNNIALVAIRGWSLGQRLAGLRVVGYNDRPPGWRRTVIRLFAFSGLRGRQPWWMFDAASGTSLVVASSLPRQLDEP